MQLPRSALATGLALLIAGFPASASAAAADEDLVKAAFLSKFARYVTWPAPARAADGAPLTICIIGADGIGQLVRQAVSGQRIDDHPIMVRQATAGPGAAGCHIAFVQGPSDAATAAALAALGRYPILTVTDQRAGATRGIIHFMVVANRVRFSIDNDGATRRGLDISSRLLSLAIGVNP